MIFPTTKENLGMQLDDPAIFKSVSITGTWYFCILPNNLVVGKRVALKKRKS